MGERCGGERRRNIKGANVARAQRWGRKVGDEDVEIKGGQTVQHLHLVDHCNDHHD